MYKFLKLAANLRIQKIYERNKSKFLSGVCQMSLRASRIMRTPNEVS